MIRQSRLQVEISKSAPVGFLACMDDSNCFRQCKAENNTFGSEYHVREPVCTTMTASLSEFGRNLKQWQKKSVLLQVILAIRSGCHLLLLAM